MKSTKKYYKFIFPILMFLAHSISSAQITAVGSQIGQSQSTTYSTTVLVPEERVGNANIYLAFLLNNYVYFWSESTGFVPYSGQATVPFVRKAVSSTESFSLTGLDIRSAIGTLVYVGYGSTVESMVENGTYVQIGKLVDRPPGILSLFKTPETLFGGFGGGCGFFSNDCSDTLLSLPYSTSSMMSASVNCIGSGCASTYKVGEFKLKASGQSFTIVNLQAINNNSFLPITPFFDGLVNNQKIDDGQSVSFSLHSPFTGGQYANLTYSFTILETGETFNYTVQLKTN